jgi:hypothetical protein
MTGRMSAGGISAVRRGVRYDSGIFDGLMIVVVVVWVDEDWALGGGLTPPPSVAEEVEEDCGT